MASRPVLEPTHPPIQWVPGGTPSPGLKRPRSEADRSPPSSVEVKNGGAIPLLCSPIRLHGTGKTFLDFDTITFLQCKVISPASNPHPKGLGPCIYIIQWQGGLIIPPSTGFPLYRLIWIAGLPWRSNWDVRLILGLLNDVSQLRRLSSVEE
jgi:hypothetical protein